MTDPPTATEKPAERALAEMVPGPGHGLWRLAALAACVVVVAALAASFGLWGRLTDVQQWMRDQGPAAPLVFVLILVVAAVVLVPGTVFCVAAGMVLDPLVAVVCASIGRTLGACAAFLIARSAARRTVARWVARREKYQHLDDLVALHGAHVVALSRLFPVSFNIMNYALGLTRVRFITYAFWSWLCMLPGILILVASGVVLSTVMQTFTVPWRAVNVAFGSMALMLLLAGLVFARLLWVVHRR